MKPSVYSPISPSFSSFFPSNCFYRMWWSFTHSLLGNTLPNSLSSWIIHETCHCHHCWHTRYTDYYYLELLLLLELELLLLLLLLLLLIYVEMEWQPQLQSRRPECGRNLRRTGSVSTAIVQLGLLTLVLLLLLPQMPLLPPQSWMAKHNKLVTRFYPLERDMNTFSDLLILYSAILHG